MEMYRNIALQDCVPWKIIIATYIRVRRIQCYINRIDHIGWHSKYTYCMQFWTISAAPPSVPEGLLREGRLTGLEQEGEGEGEAI